MYIPMFMLRWNTRARGTKNVQRPLGAEFLVEVDRAIEKVRESPMIWPFGDEDRGIRRYLVHRFPYGVVYRVSNQIIQIIAVMLLRRHPDYWRGRVQYWKGGHTERSIG
jgi:toxin ParE1/3/4